MTDQRSQIDYPLDLQSIGAIQDALDDIEKNHIRKRTRVPKTLATGANDFSISSEYLILTGDAAGNVIGTIGGGREGQTLIIDFVDNHVTLTDDASGNPDTINLAGAGVDFNSTANDVVTLIYNGKSWKEVSRSVN